MPPKTKKDVLKEAVELTPTVHVGKDGITDSLVDEVILQLKTRKVIKVKMLPAAGEDKKQIALDLAERSRATLIDVRGSIATFSEKRYFGGKAISEPRE